MYSLNMPQIARKQQIERFESAQAVGQSELSRKHSPEFETNGMNVDLIKLIGFLTEFQAVERQMYIPKLGRLENDSEHSYNLVMAAWLIISKDQLPLDIDLAIKYALVHDLVEVYAGDASALDDEQIKTKVIKEHAALQRLKSSELTAGIAKLIEEYERLDNEESNFVYALDKLMASFTIIHGKVAVWKQHGITQSVWQNKFQAKIEKSPYLRSYLEECLRLQRAHPELMPDLPDQ